MEACKKHFFPRLPALWLGNLMLARYQSHRDWPREHAETRFPEEFLPGRVAVVNALGELLGGFPIPKEDELGQVVWVCSSWPYGWPRSPMGVESHGCPLEGGSALLFPQWQFVVGTSISWLSDSRRLIVTRCTLDCWSGLMRWELVGA